jgi:type IV pilus assembly protein PilM
LLSRRSATTGIDLGHQAVKLVRLETDGSVAKLTHWGIEEIPATASEGQENRTEALLRLMRRLRLRPRHLGRIAVALGGGEIHLRQISMPKLAPEDLRKALHYEARKHLPIENLVDPCLDFQVLDGVISKNGGGETQEVLLVAAPRESRKRTLDVLEQVGIRIETLDAEPLPSVNAVLSAYPTNDDDGWVVVLDLGARSSTLAAVLSDGGFYSRPLDFTGDTLTRAIESQLELDHPDAEILKREIGNSDSRAGEPVVTVSIRALVRELEETIRFLRFRKRDQPVSRIFLCGGSSLLFGLREKLEEALGIDVIHPDPFQGVDSEGRRSDPAETLRLVGALGLARWWE